MNKRLLPITLCLIVIITAFAVPTFASSEPSIEKYTLSSEKIVMRTGGLIFQSLATKAHRSMVPIMNGKIISAIQSQIMNLLPARTKRNVGPSTIIKAITMRLQQSKHAN